MRAHLIWITACLAACGATDDAADRTLDDAPGVLESGPSAPNLGKADGVTTPALSDPLPADANLDAPFQALFVPDDPTLALELNLLDRVIAARAEDAAA